MEEYDRDAQELESNFRENQEKEKLEFEKELETSVQSKVRPTPKLLNMKYRIEQLSKYQRFEEAGKLQDQYNLEVKWLQMSWRVLGYGAGIWILEKRWL